jgi:phosphate transport system substrate-binding protein
LLRIYETGFRKLQPGVKFEEDLKSTVTAVSGVASGRAEIGLLGREIWPSEVQAFQDAKGHAPKVIDIATGSYDVPKATFALMVFVNAANPLRSLSTAQLEKIFAQVESGSIESWGELGLKGEWAARPVHLYGFAKDNDKAMIFSKIIFSRGEDWSSALHEFANTTGAQPVDAGELIVKAVAGDPAGIGISNVHYAMPKVSAEPEVRAVAIATGDAVPIPPTREEVSVRRYPLTRAVYVVVDDSPDHPMNTAAREFLRYVLSRNGQENVRAEGNYIPLTRAIADEQMKLLTR